MRWHQHADFLRKDILGCCSVGSTQEFNPGENFKVSFSGMPDRVILISGRICSDLEFLGRFSGALVLYGELDTLSFMDGNCSKLILNCVTNALSDLKF